MTDFSGSRKPCISIIMPCLNEEQTVAICVRKARKWLTSAAASESEVIVVDNGSSDRSSELAASAGARVIQESRRGYGAALRAGFAAARGDWIVMGDCDDTYDFSDLSPLVAPLAQGYDMVVGDRFAGGIAPGAMVWSHRYIGTPAISSLIRVLTGISAGDSQCGLRALTADALRQLDLQTDGMELASEMILKAARRKLRVDQVPVPYGERLGQAKLDTMRDGWRHLKFLLLASPGHLFTLPGLILAILGVLLVLASVGSETLELGPLRWQPIYAGSIFAVVGVNAVLIGLAARLYTTSRGITEADLFTRLYRRYLGLEGLGALGLTLGLAGIALNVALAFVELPGVNRLGAAAVAQTLILIGANLLLVAALIGILES